jgi:pimeloyl-ACP methyl ester carboxylesterase
LENQFELILPDMRGSGASGHASPPAYGVMDQVRDILALVDAEPGDPLDLVGHSFGGHVAMCVAALRPQRVRRLLLEDAPLMVAGGRLQGRPAGPGFSAWLSILCTRPDAPELMEAIVREYPDMTGPQRRMRLQSLMALDPMLLDVYVNGAPFAGYDPHDLAPRVMCPALVLQADPAREARIDDEAAQLFCDLAPIATRRVMEGAGHGIHTDQPEVFVGILRGFLDG